MNIATASGLGLGVMLLTAGASVAFAQVTAPSVCVNGVPCVQDKNGEFVGVVVGWRPNLNPSGGFSSPNYIMTVSRKFQSASYAFDLDPLSGVIQSAVFYYTQAGCAGTAYIEDDDSRLPQPASADGAKVLWFGSGAMGSSANLFPLSQKDALGNCTATGGNIQGKPAQVLDASVAKAWVGPFSIINLPSPPTLYLSNAEFKGK